MVLLVNCSFNYSYYYYYYLLHCFYFSEAATIERLPMFQRSWESQPGEVWSPTNHPQRLGHTQTETCGTHKQQLSMLAAMYELTTSPSKELRKRNMQRYLYYTEVEELSPTLVSMAGTQMLLYFLKARSKMLLLLSLSCTGFQYSSIH